MPRWPLRIASKIGKPETLPTDSGSGKRNEAARGTPSEVDTMSPSICTSPAACSCRRMQLAVAHRAEGSFQMLRDVAQRQVDGLEAARGLLGDQARLRLELAAGVAHRGFVALDDVVRGEGEDRGDQRAADPGDPAAVPVARIASFARRSSATVRPG